MKMVEKLNRLMRECYDPKSGSGSEYTSEDDFDSGHPSKRFLTDDDIYADNGYDGDFEMPDAYTSQRRYRDDDFYNQYESLKRPSMRCAKRVNESRGRRISHQLRHSR